MPVTFTNQRTKIYLAQKGPAKVVGEDDQDIWDLRRCLRCHSQRSESEEVTARHYSLLLRLERQFGTDLDRGLQCPVHGTPVCKESVYPLGGLPLTGIGLQP